METGTPTYRKLLHEVHLKQLQINGLMAITQAINENVKAPMLFTSYQKFLHLELQVGCMALYFRENGKWTCVTHYGFDLESRQPQEIDPILAMFKNRAQLSAYESDPFLGIFDIVIPVFHKQNAIAYVFIGDLKEEDDILSNINFITTITNIISVAIENKRLFKEQAENEMIGREMELAGQIQRTLIPTRLPGNQRIQFTSIYKPHFAVGGDYFDVVELPNDEIVFCIADISGKGISAALLMANFQAKLHALLLRGFDLKGTISEMNSYVQQITQGERFITMFLAKFDSATLKLQYVNAGHVPPLLIDGDEIKRLQAGCTLLGILPQLKVLELGEVIIKHPNALFFSYTDGLTDVMNTRGDSFNEGMLTEYLIANKESDIQIITEDLLDTITRFKSNLAFPDDITVLAARITRD